MSWLKKISFLFLMFFCSHSFAQKGILKQANKYFEAERYQEALELYNQLDDIRGDKSTLFNRGVANLRTNNAKAAVTDFFSAKREGFDGDEIYLLTGESLHHQGKFAEAVPFYKDYIRYTDDYETHQRVMKLIRQCQFGINNQYNDQLAFVENLGRSVNTEYDEINPVQSPTSQNKYYFSSNRAGSEGGLRNEKGLKDDIFGKYSCDMYAVQLEGGNWTPVSAFHPILNGPKNDLIQAFSSDGSVMYYIQTRDGADGKLYSDTFQLNRDETLFPTELVLPAITTLGDKDIQIFNNNTILFSSAREGGFGGFDIYVSYLDEDGWSVPQNLGSDVNSEYDEVSPFLAKSGNTLYYSTNSDMSFGGFDIMSASFRGRNQWEVVNLGQPINSAKDDYYFSLSSDGMTAIFSSDRAGSYGGMDLYLAYYKDLVVDILMYIEEVPFISKPDSNIVEVADIEEIPTEEPTNVIPTKKREFYNEALYYGDDEIIESAVNLPKLESIKDMLNVFPEMEVILTGNSISEGMREFDLYFTIKRAEKAAQYLIENGIRPERIHVRGLGSNYPLARQNPGPVSYLVKKNNRRIDVSFANVDNEKFEVIEESLTLSDQLRDPAYSSYKSTVAGLSYKVRIANTKQMFKGDLIRNNLTGSVDRTMDNDSYNYSVGIFENFNQANLFKNKLVREGIIDAEVRAYINGKYIPKTELMDLQSLYPDLSSFLAN